MKGSAPVLETLQSAAAAEAHLNLQYRLDARSLKFMGIKQVAKKTDEFGSDTHDFLKYVTKRILFLEGDPSYQIPKIVEQSTLTALFKAELALELAIVKPYEDAVQVAMNALDDTTRNLFEHLLKWHEKHVDWLERQLRLIEGMGEATYISAKL